MKPNETSTIPTIIEHDHSMLPHWQHDTTSSSRHMGTKSPDALQHVRSNSCPCFFLPDFIHSVVLVYWVVMISNLMSSINSPGLAAIFSIMTHPCKAFVFLVVPPCHRGMSNKWRPPLVPSLRWRMGRWSAGAARRTAATTKKCEIDCEAGKTMGDFTRFDHKKWDSKPGKWTLNQEEFGLKPEKREFHQETCGFHWISPRKKWVISQNGISWDWELVLVHRFFF